MDNKLLHMTQPAKDLCRALEKRGIFIEPEHWDGHKHVDIHIPDVDINIEVDGPKHLTDPDQILADFKREHFSDAYHLDTLHIPNEVLEENLDSIADAIAEVVVKRRLQRAKA